MSKIQKQRNNSGGAPAKNESKDKVWYAKLRDPDLALVWIYDLDTWIGIPISISLALIFGIAKSWRAFGWSIGGLLLLTVVMLAIRVRQHNRAIEGQRNEPRERPELYVREARMTPLVEGKPEIVVLGIGNRGNATARKIKLGCGNHFFASSSFEGPLEYKPIAVDSQPDLGPGEEKSMLSHAFEPLSKERIKDLQEGRLLFFHYAEGEYDDDNGTTYPIDFCFMYAPHAPTTMRICPEKYWPKERKDRRFPGRPELVIEQVVMEPLEAGERETISLIVRNCGNSTAHNVAIMTTHAHKPAAFQGPLVYDILPPDTHSDIHANGVMTLISRSPWLMDLGHIHSIAARSRLLFVYGKVSYCDDFSRKYDLRFCYMFEPAFPRNMIIAPDRYWPKDEEKNDGAQKPN